MSEDRGKWMSQFKQRANLHTLPFYCVQALNRLDDVHLHCQSNDLLCSATNSNVNLFQKHPHTNKNKWKKNLKKKINKYKNTLTDTPGSKDLPSSCTSLSHVSWRVKLTQKVRSSGKWGLRQKWKEVSWKSPDCVSRENVTMLLINRISWGLKAYHCI